MTLTISSSLCSMTLLPLLTLVVLATSSSDALACGNAMENVIHHEPTTMMASEYFEDHGYLQAAITALDAHPELTEDFMGYTRHEDPDIQRASQIAAISIVRLHGADYKTWHEKALGLDSSHARFEWAVGVLQWHHARASDDLTSAVYLAEAQARSSDADTLRQAFVTLSLAAELDLMPDAHAWATLAALQRKVDIGSEVAVASCKKIGGFKACDSLPLSFDEESPYMAYLVRSKRREVIEGPFVIENSFRRRRVIRNWD